MDWDVSTVGKEFEIKLGKMLDAEKNVGIPKPYLGNKAVQWDRIEINNLPTVPMSRTDLGAYRLRKGDLLVCEGGEVGRACIWNAPIEECYFQKALHRLRPIRGFDPKLMAAFLKQWSERGVLANYVTQTSIAHLPREKFLQIPLPVPPASEQHAISTVLSDINSLINGLESLITKKRNLKQAAMQQLLTGQTRLPGFSGAWEVKRLGDVAEIIMGQSPSSSNYNEKGLGLPLIQGNADIANRKTIRRIFTTEITKLGKLGDILMSVRAPVGEISRAMFDVCLGRGVCAIRYTNDFMYHYLVGQEPRWARHSKGSTFESVNSADIKLLNLCLPTDASEQVAIAAILSDMDIELTALELQREKTCDIRQGMMQELLTGKTRLI
ncbi:MAG: restriction endonuclease subunit S [Pseudomonadota bacterium]